MFGVGLYVYQRGFFPRKTPRWLLNIVQTWHKPYKLGSNCVHILAKPKLAGLSDTNRQNRIDKTGWGGAFPNFEQTVYKPYHYPAGRGDGDTPSKRSSRRLETTGVHDNDKLLDGEQPVDNITDVEQAKARRT